MNMLEMFSQGLFEGVKPMMVARDYLVRHPDRCTHQAICIPVCPTGAWLSTPPFKFDSSRCMESCRLCLDAVLHKRSMPFIEKARRFCFPKRRLNLNSRRPTEDTCLIGERNSNNHCR